MIKYKEQILRVKTRYDILGAITAHFRISGGEFPAEEYLMPDSIVSLG